MTLKGDSSNHSVSFHQNLQSNVRASLEMPRPILVHLNADTTWLLQLPYPPGAKRPSGRSRFNILIDPWLRGRQSDVAAWFSSQWHAADASVQSIAELNKVLEANEAFIRMGKANECENSDTRNTNFIDAVVVSHEFTDHCHKQTLLEIDQTTPVFGTNKAVRLIKSWRHFDSVIETRAFSQEDSTGESTSLSSLLDWLGIARVVSQRDALYYHSAILITFNLGQQKNLEHQKGPSIEAVIYTPHGINAQDLHSLTKAQQAITILTLIHGLHDIRLSRKQLNLGAHNGLRAQRICKAKYWVSTHDEVKRTRGLIAPILYRKTLTLKEALEEEKKQSRGGTSIENDLAGIGDITFVDLKSGESLLLL